MSEPERKRWSDSVGSVLRDARARCRSFGPRAAWNSLSTWVVNQVVVRANRRLPARFECPCCGHRAWRFLDHDVVGYAKRNSVCPGCGSHEKHRAAYLTLVAEIATWPKGTRVLHVAPERPLDLLFSSRPDLRRVRLDLYADGVDVKADLQRIPFPSATFDRVFVFHVLDYVSDDRRALRELHRVTASGGILDLLLPIPRRGPTVELPRPDPLDSFHIRRYGADIEDRVREAGFRIEAPPNVSFPPRAAASFGAAWLRARRSLP